MKTILILLTATLFIACDKDNCESCTRTWKYKSYILLSTGGQTSVTNYDGGTETFTACGDDMIEAEERIQTTYAKVPVTGYTNKWSVAEGTGTCKCN